MKKGLVFKIIAPSVTAILLAVAIIASVVVKMPTVAYSLNNYVIGFKEPPMTEERGMVSAEGDELAELIALEGAVLTKNDNNTLPFKSTEAKKVNVFGWGASSWVAGGSGSGRAIQNMSTDTLENPEAPYTGTPRWSNFSAKSLYAEIDIYGALMKYGIEFNTDLRDFYVNYNSGSGSGKLGANLNIGKRPYIDSGTLNSYDYQFSRIIEPKISDYGSRLDEAKQFTDEHAIVVITRVSGESSDSPKVQYKGYAASTAINDDTRHYLEISTEEEDLLRHVGANYKNVVVLINSTNTMELGFLDTIPGLDACLIVGTTGPRAATAIPKLLFDEVTYLKAKADWTGDTNEAAKWELVTEKGYVPSGRTVNTYAYDFKTNPSWASMGHPENSNFGAAAPDGSGQKYYDLGGNDKMPDGKTVLYPFNLTSNNYGNNPRYAGLAYIDYMESIYVDYKWYETADKMGYWNTHSTPKTPAGKTGYNGIVQYPFGYGLSYTTFTHEIFGGHTIIRNGESLVTGTLQKDDKIQVKVRVSNTGKVAAKDVVQLYFDPPYTPGGVEKASANLVAFAKTQIIEPGHNEVVTLEFDAYDMASYDSHNKSNKVGANGGYILEGGSYEIKLMDNAHNVGKGLTKDKATIPLTVPAAGIVYSEDPNAGTGIAVQNRFTGAAARLATGDGVPVDGSDESTPIKFLSRSSFTTTFPTVQEQRNLTDEVRALNRYTNTSEKAMAWNAANQPATAPKVGQGDNGMRMSTGSGATAVPTALALELGADYNSEKWEQLLSQMTVTQLMNYTLQGGTNTISQNEIGMPENPMRDGPSQFGGWSGNNVGTGFPNATVVAQTFNVQLSYKMGLQVGNDAKANAHANGGWLAPGLNIHRSPLGSRNYEYYSADPVLSGKMAAMVIQGCKNKGVFTYIKHLALYDQDTNRDSIYTWATEQAIREIYLKPFRIAIQEGGATGLMTAYNRFGANWGGGSYAMITNVIREEMGFKGSIETDWIDRAGYMDISHALRAGGDLSMASSPAEGKGVYNNWENKNDLAFQAALVRACKNIAYTWAEAKYTESIYDADNDPLNTTSSISSSGDLATNFNWITILAIPFLYVLAIGGGGALCFLAYKPKKQRVLTPQDSTN